MDARDDHRSQISDADHIVSKRFEAILQERASIDGHMWIQPDSHRR